MTWWILTCYSMNIFAHCMHFSWQINQFLLFFHIFFLKKTKHTYIFSIFLLYIYINCLPFLKREQNNNYTTKATLNDLFNQVQTLTNNNYIVHVIFFCRFFLFYFYNAILLFFKYCVYMHMNLVIYIYVWKILFSIWILIIWCMYEDYVRLHLADLQYVLLCNMHFWSFFIFVKLEKVWKVFWKMCVCVCEYH